MTLGIDESPLKAPGSRSRNRILVVEDDPIQRRVVARLLLRWAFEPIEAADGGVAIGLLRDSGTAMAVILLDMMLPVVDGVGVAREATRLHPTLPIVACSAAFNDRMEADLRALGVRHFLPKPYTADLLRSILDGLTRVEPPA